MTEDEGASPPHAPSRRHRAVFGTAAALLLLIAYVDYATGIEVRVFPFYFLPVALVSWNFGRAWGLVVALACAIAWTLANVLTGHAFSHPFYLVWNALIQLGTFSIIAVILSRVASSLGAERESNERLSSALARVDELHESLTQKHNELARVHAAIDRDLEMAAVVQRAMLLGRTTRFPGLDVAFRYRPAMHVGGDIVIAHPVSSERTMFFVGDVMGHGTRAALVAAAANTIVRRAVAVQVSPAGVLRELNTVMMDEFPGEFLTGVAGVVDVGVGTVTVAIAGHPRPLWLRADSPAEELGAPDFPLGFARIPPYEDSTVELRPRDLVAFFTDGLVEAGEVKRRFGLQRVREQLERHAARPVDEIVNQVMEEVTAVCGKDPFEDDATLLLVRFTP